MLIVDVFVVGGHVVPRGPPLKVNVVDDVNVFISDITVVLASCLLLMSFVGGHAVGVDLLKLMLIC